MSITAKEDIVIGKEDVQESKDLNFGVRKIQFAHKFTGGETAVDLANLVLPSELAPMVNPSPAEIAGCHLSLFKKNVRLSLSRGIELKPYAHYLISSESRISFVNDLYNSGGALPGEILYGEIDLVPANQIVVADARRFVKTGTITAGQTTVNLGHEFKVNANPFDQVGDFILMTDDGRLFFRNVGNAAASILADGNFQEVDSGNGYGTQIILNQAFPVDTPYAAIFGLQMASGDLGIWGAIEQLQGSLLKLGQDAAIGFGTSLVDYIQANPTQLERRYFGDIMLKILGLEVNQGGDKYMRMTYSTNAGNSGSSGNSGTFKFNGTYTDVGDTTLMSRVQAAAETQYVANRKLLVHIFVRGIVNSAVDCDIGAALYESTGVLAVPNHSIGSDESPNTNYFLTANGQFIMEAGQYFRFSGQEIRMSSNIDLIIIAQELSTRKTIREFLGL